MMHYLLMFCVANALFSDTSYQQTLEKKRELDLPRISDSDEIPSGRPLRPREGPNKADGDSDFNSNLNELYPRPVSTDTANAIPADDIADKINEMDAMKEKLNKALGTNGNVGSLTDKNMWKGLYDHIILKFPDLSIDGHLGIQLHIRYFLCCYIVAFIPAEFAFFFPGVYKRLIPKKAYTVPILGDALIELETFLRFVRIESKTSFIITFFLGRRNSVKEDLKFLLEVPDKIFSDPMYLLREVLAFEIRAEGYKDYKKSLEKK